MGGMLSGIYTTPPFRDLIKVPREGTLSLKSGLQSLEAGPSSSRSRHLRLVDPADIAEAACQIDGCDDQDGVVERHRPQMAPIAGERSLP